MGRLIDANSLKECYTGTNALDGKADYMSIRKMIDNQPTAYDVEKVVAELEDLEEDFCQCFRKCEEQCFIQRAIDIVRKGGVE